MATLDHAEEMPSTSTRARETLAATPTVQLPLLVLTNQQTAGRGQPGKNWFADDDSLTFTWCAEIGADLLRENAGVFALAAGLSVCEAITSLGIAGAKIKWPNDVLIDHHKVAGILVEQIRRPEFDLPVVLFGIGLNVNQSHIDAADLVAGPALSSAFSPTFPPASLQQLTGQSWDHGQLLKLILDTLSNDVATLDSASIIARCQARLAFRNRPIIFATPQNDRIAGFLVGIAPTGGLIIKTPGSTEIVYSGSIIGLAPDP